MQKEEYEIIGKHIQDPPDGKLIDHFCGPDGSTRNTALAQTCVASIKKDLEREFWLAPKPDHDRICIRMAGTALISRNLGHAIQWTEIRMEHGQWFGRVQCKPMTAADKMEFALFKVAAGAIAGFATEKYLDLPVHPCSFVRVKATAAVVSKYMGVPLGKREWHFFQRSLDWCGAVISANRDVFNTLTHRLSRSEHINDKAMRSLLKATKRIPMDWYVYAD